MINLDQENWDKICNILVKEYGISAVARDAWINKLSVHSVEGNTVILTIDESISQLIGYVRDKFLQPLKVTISEYFKEDCEVIIATRSEVRELEENKKKPEPKKEAKSASVNSDLMLNPKYKFDTFVVGKNNELAYATALAVASDPGEYGNPLFIYGGVGLGKTHLMQSIAHYIITERPDYRIIYTTTETFSSELITAIKNRTQESFKNKYRDIDVLLIDDIQFIAGKDSTMEEFFHTFNALYDRKKQIVISADKPPRDMVDLEERLVSRFKVGLTVDIQPPDYDTRVAILAKRAEIENIDIDEAAMHYIAEHIKSNIRELEGALNTISNYARLRHADHIDVQMTQEVLKDIIEPEKQKVITPDLIIETVADHFNYKVTAADIKGKNRSRDIAYPRQICMYLCEKYTGLSLASIGKALGGKDHTTVLHGARKIKEDMEKDEKLRSTIDVLTKKLNP